MNLIQLYLTLGIIVVMTVLYLVWRKEGEENKLRWFTAILTVLFWPVAVAYIMVTIHKSRKDNN